MTDSEFVLSICPYAFAYRVSAKKYELSNPTPNGTYVLCEGNSLDEVWRIAADKLGRKELP